MTPTANVLAIELNDTGILAVGEGGGALSPNPGYALLENDTVTVGREAARKARLSPRRIHNRFWDLIDTQPLRSPYPHNLSTADLAHAHMKQIWEETGGSADGAVLAIPGKYQEQQLGLILSVARASGIPVTGMVDAAVAAVADRDLEGRVLHLDLQLYAAVLTTMYIRSGPVRSNVVVSDATGVFPLIDTLAKHAASTFLRATRFDPLHRAPTEQTLYDQLPQWLRVLRDSDSTIVAIEAGGRRHKVELTRSGVLDAANGHLDTLAELALRDLPADATKIVLSHTSSQFPGLAARLCERTGLEVDKLPIAAAAAGALRHASAITTPGESLPFVTELGSGEGQADRTPQTQTEDDAQPASRPPTHILHEGSAYAIANHPFAIGVAIPDGERGLELTGNTAGVSRLHCRIVSRDGGVVVEDHSSYGSFVNERRVEGSELLAVGDVLRVGTPGIELRLIAVVDDDGAA